MQSSSLDDFDLSNGWVQVAKGLAAAVAGRKQGEVRRENVGRDCSINFSTFHFQDHGFSSLGSLEYPSIVHVVLVIISLYQRACKLRSVFLQLHLDPLSRRGHVHETAACHASAAGHFCATTTLQSLKQQVACWESKQQNKSLIPDM